MLNNQEKGLSNSINIHKNCSQALEFGSRITVIQVDTGAIVAQFDDVNDSMINDIAVANNGNSVIARYDDISYYDNTGKLIRKLDKYDSKAIAINPVDNNVLAIATQYQIEMWNIDTGTLIRAITYDYTEYIVNLEFSKDGTRLMYADAYSGREPTLQILNAETGERIGPKHEYKYISTQLATPQFSFDGNKIAYIVSDNSAQEHTIAVVDVETGQRLIPNILHQGSILSLAFEPNNEEILISYDQNVLPYCIPSSARQVDISRYSLANGQQVGRVFEGQVYTSDNYNDGYALAASNVTNDLLISTNTASSTILIWERKTSRIKECVNLTPDTLAHYAQISPDGKYFVVATRTHSFAANSMEITDVFELENNNCITKESVASANTSNLADITNEILKSSTHFAPICGGISEFNILDGILIGLRNKFLMKYSIPNQPSLFFQVYPSHDNPITIDLDNHRKKILIHVPLFIDVLHLKDSVRTHRVSRTRLSFTLKTKPSMVTGGDSAQSFQLDFKGSELDNTNIVPFIIDPHTVLETMGSNQALIQLIENTVADMLKASGDEISMYLSSLVANSKMPKSWNSAREYALIFKEFIFQNVTVQLDGETQNVQYVFMVFTGVSLNFPPPCICKENTEDFTPTTRTHANDPRRWISLAFSEDALNIISVPHRNSGGRCPKEEGGSLRRSVDSYHTTEIAPLNIEDNNTLIAKFSVKGGGSMSARLIGPFNSTIISLTVGYDLSAEDVKVKWDISILPNYAGENVTSVVLTPTVFLSADNIHYRFNSSFPGPLNDALSWFIEVFLKILATFISSLIISIGRIELIYDVFKRDNDDFNIIDIWITSYKGSSIVFLAEVTNCL
ncbi:hypothetical protein [uncultured Clostridium sp.]|uniref:WD40 repeat domain-containing protein n=1 Tax=uncultured Clostridium sp. TaxID=59620 RepID=UPI0028E310D4|nr:hypothetical protein [uncultured Clostridium sp.]